jgi:hypothetical protein
VAVNPFTGDFSTAFGGGSSGPPISFNIHVGLTGWVGPFNYVVGNRVVNAGNAYQCITAGTSTSGAGPTSTGSNITDGTVRWKWLSAVDFSTLAAAQAALPATFTQPITWLIWNSAGTISIPGSTTPYLTLSGHTTSSVNNLTITTAPGEGLRDSVALGHTPLAFNAAAGVSITTPTATPGFSLGWFDIADANVVIDGLQFRDPNPSSGCTLISSEAGAAGLTLRNCLFDGAAQPGPIPILSLSNTALLTNCVIIDRQPSTAASVAITANSTCTIVNCTAYAGTAASNTVMLLSNSTTVGGSRIRNTASFGYATGVGFTGGGGVSGNIIVDHCVSSSATIGSGCTDGGGNLLSRLAATNLLAPGTDLRLTLGAACVDAGVADLVDIPLGTDFAGLARPQGAAWDVGAFELAPLAMRGMSLARGRSAINTGTTGQGTARAFGRGILVASLGVLSAKGRASSRGAATGTFTQVSAPTDPWDTIFSNEFGPLTPPPLFSGFGDAMGYGRALMAVAQPLVARGASAGAGRTPSNFVNAALTSRSSGRDTGRTAMTVAKSLSAVGVTKASGLAAVTIAKPLAGRGQAAGTDLAGLGRTAFFSVTGRAAARGAAAISAPVVLSGRSRASGSGRGLGLFSAGALIGGGVSRGRGVTEGQAGLLASALLQTIGTAMGRGNALYGSNVVVLPGAGQSTAAGQAQRLLQTSALLAKSNAAGFGRLAQGGLQSLTAAGLGAKTMARATAVYNAFLPSRGRSYAKGKLTNPALTVALASVGVTQGKGKAAQRYQALMNASSRSAGSGRTDAKNTQPLVATGLTSATGTLGGNGIQRLVTTRGSSAAHASAGLSSLTMLAATGKTAGSGKPGLLLSRPLQALGVGAALNGFASFAGQAALSARGALQAAGSILGAFSVDFSGVGMVAGYAVGRMTQAALISGAGQSSATAGLDIPTGRVSLSALGRSVASGQSTNLVFAPIALVASGQARITGSSRTAATTALRGTTLGLSAGRAASIQTTLLMATGRSRAAGQLAAALAVGLQARANGAARGRLYSLNAFAASGLAHGHGSARIAGYYNVTPDEVGPTLQSLGFQPAFDPMDLGDIDFVSWNWGARASVTGDPIITASVTASPAGLPVGTPVVVGNIVQVRVGPATVVETFTLRCSVSLRSGRVLHWSAPVAVEDF